eukprot:219021-Chlamydomonas_euryale.AAC.4
MNILSGRDTNCEGNVFLAPGIKIGYLEQEPDLNDGATVGENVEAGVKVGTRQTYGLLYFVVCVGGGDYV